MSVIVPQPDIDAWKQIDATVQALQQQDIEGQCRAHEQEVKVRKQVWMHHRFFYI